MSSERTQPEAGRIFKRFHDTNLVGFLLFFPLPASYERKKGRNWTFHWETESQTLHIHCPCARSCPSATYSLEFGRRRKMHLREGKSHQGPTDHNEVQDIPQVTEVGARVEQQPQVNHLQRKPRKRKGCSKAWPKSTPPRGRRRLWIKGPFTNCSDTQLSCCSLKLPQKWSSDQETTTKSCRNKSPHCSLGFFPQTCINPDFILHLFSILLWQENPTPALPQHWILTLWNCALWEVTAPQSWQNLSPCWVKRWILSFFETCQTKNQLLFIFLLSAKGEESGVSQQGLAASLCLPSSDPLTQAQLLKTSWFSSIKYKIKEARRAAATDCESCSQLQALHPSFLCPAPPFLQILTKKSERRGDSLCLEKFLP